MSEPQTIILTDGKHNLHVVITATPGNIQLRALAAGEEVGDVRLVWNSGMLWLDAWTADEIAASEETPELDMRVLYSLD